MNAGLSVFDVGALVIAALGLTVSFALFLVTRRQTASVESDEARDEAMDLADIRGKVIEDLRRRQDELERAQAEERVACDEKIDQLRKAVELAREEAAENQRLLLVGLRGALTKVLGHLELDPPETEEAIQFLRDCLDTEAPPSLGYPHRRRRTP